MIKYGCCIWSWCCSVVKILRVLDSHWWKKLLLNELFFQKKHFPSGTYFIFKIPRSFFLSNTSYICHVIHVPVPILVLLRLKILCYLGFLPKYSKILQLYFPPFYFGKIITRIFSHVSSIYWCAAAFFVHCTKMKFSI